MPFSETVKHFSKHIHSASTSETKPPFYNKLFLWTYAYYDNAKRCDVSHKCAQPAILSPRFASLPIASVSAMGFMVLDVLLSLPNTYVYDKKKHQACAIYKLYQYKDNIYLFKVTALDGFRLVCFIIVTKQVC